MVPSTAQMAGTPNNPRPRLCNTACRPTESVPGSKGRAVGEAVMSPTKSCPRARSRSLRGDGDHGDRADGVVTPSGHPHRRAKVVGLAVDVTGLAPPFLCRTAYLYELLYGLFGARWWMRTVDFLVNAAIIDRAAGLLLGTVAA